MRRYLLCLLLTLGSIGQALAQKTFIDHFSDMDGVSSVYISKTMIRLLPKLEVNNKDLKHLAGKIDGIQILNADEPAPARKLKEGAQALIKKLSYEPLMEMKDDDTRTNIYLLDLGKGRSAFALLASEPDATSLIVITGTLSVEDIKKITDRP